MAKCCDLSMGADRLIYDNQIDEKQNSVFQPIHWTEADPFLLIWDIVFGPDQIGTVTVPIY